MTTFAEGLGMQSYTALDAAEGLVADDPALRAELIIAAWDYFIPKIGGRVLQTDADLAMWQRMPLWQKNGLRLRDEAFLAHGSEVVGTVMARVRELAGAVAVAQNEREQWYHQ